MFGANVIGSNQGVPVWIMGLVREVERDYGFRVSVFFKEPKKERFYNACYWPHKKSIDLYFHREETALHRWIVLHELAHAIQDIVLPHTKTPTPVWRTNRIVHNHAFFNIAKKLYIRYNVLDIAAQKEYKRARAMMVA